MKNLFCLLSVQLFAMYAGWIHRDLSAILNKYNLNEMISELEPINDLSKPRDELIIFLLEVYKKVTLKNSSIELQKEMTNLFTWVQNDSLTFGDRLSEVIVRELESDDNQLVHYMIAMYAEIQFRFRTSELLANEKVINKVLLMLNTNQYDSKNLIHLLSGLYFKTSLPVPSSLTEMIVDDVLENIHALGSMKFDPIRLEAHLRKKLEESKNQSDASEFPMQLMEILAKKLEFKETQFVIVKLLQKESSEFFTTLFENSWSDPIHVFTQTMFELSDSPDTKYQVYLSLIQTDPIKIAKEDIPNIVEFTLKAIEESNPFVKEKAHYVMKALRNAEVSFDSDIVMQNELYLSNERSDP